jgi:hypothetical protein
MLGCVRAINLARLEELLRGLMHDDLLQSEKADAIAREL